jgi:hypothetical protein
MRKMIKCEKERIKLKRSFVDFVRFFALLTAMFGVSPVGAAQVPNPRSAAPVNVAPQRVGGNAVVRGSGDNTQTVVNSARSSMRTSGTVSRSAVNNDVRGITTARSATNARGATVSRSGTANVARGATVSRAATNKARAGVNVSNSGLARAGARARATAVFTDISKIGGGCAACREAYATCMDQFCANANDTYRRCYCSEKFTQFRDTELALDEAKTLLMQFEDNNLNAIDKTAAEVDAMYSATVGEAAIKKDTSGAQKTLDAIGDLLSGKKKASPENNTSTSLGIMSFDFSSSVDDIWGGGGSSIFDSDTGVDLTSLEGKALFDASNKQCLQLIADQCDNAATLNMATSAYGIMITQDCNAYEKKVDAQREAVIQTVRQAEKILRDARLEEYRAHNSADVNECISKVKSAILADTACGANYKRCLDYSGAYVNQTTGEAIYSPRLFELENIISLGGADADTDLLGQNAKFNQFLDEKKMFATSALDTCRDLSDVVWAEFKRSALIEIAQAQDELIEATKMSCVSTMKECYDTQSSALKEFDDTTAQAAGALSAYAAKSMCQEKVTACAALYGNNKQCTFDGNGHLTSDPSSCGLVALLSFVDTVDDVRVAEGCATAIDNYVQELCTPTTGDKGFPWNCRKINMYSDKTGDDIVSDTTSVQGLITGFAVQNCSDPTAGEKTYAALPLQTRTQVEKAISDIEEQLDYQLMDACESLDGYWLEEYSSNDKLLDVFYASAFGGQKDTAATSVGVCVENSTRTQCLNYNTADGETMASYDLAKDECIFTDAWYERQCWTIGGYYDNGMCYVGKK